MKKNFLISTGGSGGHVIPATILYEHLIKERNVIISCDKRGLKYLEKNYEYKIIDTPKLNNILFLPINLIIIFVLTIKSFFLLKTEKIEKLFSTGGYMSLPVIFAARLLKLKIYLIEPNQVLGRANKFFLSSCQKIFCYTDKIKNFPLEYCRSRKSPSRGIQFACTLNIFKNMLNRLKTCSIYTYIKLTIHETTFPVR